MFFYLGGIWMLVFLAPVLLVPTYGIVVVAERYLCLPSIGFCLLASGFLGAISRLGRRWRPAVAVAAIVGALVAGGLSSSRARVWMNDVTLGVDMVRTSRSAAFANNQLGTALLAAERYREARESFTKSVTLEPLNPGYHNNLGISLRRLGQPVLASEAFRRSLQLNPNAVGPRLKLAYTCISLGDMDSVMEQRKALAVLDPVALKTLDGVLEEWERRPRR